MRRGPRFLKIQNFKEVRSRSDWDAGFIFTAGKVSAKGRPILFPNKFIEGRFPYKPPARWGRSGFPLRKPSVG